MQMPSTDLEIGRKCDAFFAKGDHLPNLFAVLQSQNIITYCQKMADTIDVTDFPSGYK